MRILLAIVHHWNPEGGGRHQSLRPDPAPRIEALEQQILAFARLGANQLHLHLGDQAAYPANLEQRHQIDLHLITDGEHHVIDHLHDATRLRIQPVACPTDQPLMLGFEAQRHLACHLDSEYDLYAYFEDDIIVRDPQFFLKIKQFADRLGADHVLLPQRYELMPIPCHIDKLYIDGTLTPEELGHVIPEPGPPVQLLDGLTGPVRFEAPRNPHAGCFVLTHAQLSHWVQQPWWQDRDCGFVTPLESAATLGLLKTFRLYKPAFSHAAWLEAQHWGTGFLALLANATTQRPEHDG